jgi:hypothetical protein
LLAEGTGAVAIALSLSKTFVPYFSPCNTTYPKESCRFSSQVKLIDVLKTNTCVIGKIDHVQEAE